MVDHSSDAGTPARIGIFLDVCDESPLTVAIWAHLAARRLLDQLWDHGVLAEVARVEISGRSTADLNHETLADPAARPCRCHGSSR
jgi:hypothetical protein